MYRVGVGARVVRSSLAARSRSLVRRRLTTPPKESPKAAPEAAPSSAPPATAEGVGKIPVTWGSLVVSAVLGGCVTALYVRDRMRAQREYEKRNTRVVGKALLGGAWELVDGSGRLRTHADICPDPYTHILLYFGFTHCPDICPAEMLKASRIVDDCAQAGVKILPVFITCDNRRDSVGRVREYCRDFHPDMVALTGSDAQIDRACKAFRVYHSDAFDPDLDNEKNEKDEDSEYLVDHSIVLYLVDKNGEFVDFYTQLTDASEATQRILNVVKKT